jgi:TP901 family phage tail tape measure protein
MARGAREASIRLGFDQRYLRASQGQAENSLKRFGSKVGADLGRTMRGSFGGVGAIAGMIGVAGLAGEAKKVLDFETRIVRLGIASRSSMQQMALLRGEIFAVARSKGLDVDQLLGGVEKFVALTGNIEAARAALDTFGKVASASGSSVEEINIAAAALNTNLGVTGKEMEAAFGALLAQGKAGAVELKDMASILAGLTPQFATFGTTGVDGVVQLGAALQIVRSGFGSASEAATGLTSLMTAFVKESNALKKIGVDVFNVGPGGVRELKSFADIAFQLIEKSKGDPKVLSKVLGRTESLQALLPLIKAGRSEFERLVKAGQGGVAELNADFAKIAETPAHKIAAAKAQIRQIFDETLAKALPAMASAMQHIADAIGFIAAHSKEALALFVALKGGSWIGGLSGALGAVGAGGAGALGRAGGAGARGRLVMTQAGWAMVGGGGPAGPGRWGRAAGMAGSAIQGAGIGYALSGLSPHQGDQITSRGFDTAASTVAGALAMLPGPIGLAAKAALGLKAAFDLASANLDRKEAAMLAQWESDPTARQNQDILLGKSKMVEGWYDPATGQPTAVGKGTYGFHEVTNAPGSSAAQLRAARETRTKYKESVIERKGMIAYDEEGLEASIKAQNPEAARDPKWVEREKRRIYASARVLNAEHRRQLREGGDPLIDIDKANAEPYMQAPLGPQTPSIFKQAVTVTVKAGAGLLAEIENDPSNSSLGPGR